MPPIMLWLLGLCLVHVLLLHLVSLLQVACVMQPLVMLQLACVPRAELLVHLGVILLELDLVLLMY